MNWKFWEKRAEPEVAKPTIRLFNVPEDKLVLLFELHDKLDGRSKLARYNFWKAIGDIFPETLEPGTNWKVTFPRAMKIDVIEITT